MIEFYRVFFPCVQGKTPVAEVVVDVAVRERRVVCLPGIVVLARARAQRRVVCVEVRAQVRDVGARVLRKYYAHTNIVVGVKVDEPAVDMAIVSAVASSFLDKSIPDSTIVLGEVGLTGEVRAIGQVETRVAEAQKMGFTRCILPRNNLKRLTEIDGMVLTGITNVEEGIENLF